VSELRAGQTIAGKYRLNKLLGTGGMAAVWSATNMFTEREFAIKFLLPQVAKTPEAARRFLMEAKVSARVNHPNIIEIIDVGQSEDGTLFLVMELLNGVSLESALRRTNPPMSVYELIGIMLDVARALYAAHSAGVIHRDLKPTNIFLHRDRDNVAVPKLLDFGVSKFLLEEDRNQALTVAGTVLGSPLYMSPEQAMGQAQIDGRTDIFAFGAILFEGLTGFRCYDAPNFNALIVTIATTQPKSIDQAAPHLPAELRQIVKDCLVTDRNKRISSFATIIERLNALLPELEKSPLRLPPPLQPGPAPDPDDTNAMPALVKPSDRPPPPPPAENAASPATGFSVGPTSRRTPRSSGVPVGLILGAIVVALAVVGIAGGLIYVSNHPQVTAAPTPAATPVHTQQVSTAASATTIELPDPPVVDISALPSAQKKPTNAPLGKGKLSVDMAGGWCTVKIDNQEVGPTPLADHELSAGQHLVSCTPDGGKTKKEIVFIIAGETKRLKFQ
jgi:serine/threonine-protein kinase